MHVDRIAETFRAKIIDSRATDTPIEGVFTSIAQWSVCSVADEFDLHFFGTQSPDLPRLSRHSSFENPNNIAYIGIAEETQEPIILTVSKQLLDVLREVQTSVPISYPRMPGSSPISSIK